MAYCKAITGVAGADLSADTNLFKAVYSDGTDSEKFKLAIDPSSPAIVGILQNTPADDAEARVVIEGTTTAIAGGAIEPLDLITVGPLGKVVKATDADHVIGWYVPDTYDGAYTDAQDGMEIQVELFPKKVRTRKLTGTITLDQGACAASTTTNSAGQTVTGAALGDTVIITPPPTLDAGLMVSGYVSAADTVIIAFGNLTAGAINPSELTYSYTIIKP